MGQLDISVKITVLWDGGLKFPGHTFFLVGGPARLTKFDTRTEAGAEEIA